MRQVCHSTPWPSLGWVWILLGVGTSVLLLVQSTADAAGAPSSGGKPTTTTPSPSPPQSPPSGPSTKPKPKTKNKTATGPAGGSIKNKTGAGHYYGGEEYGNNDYTHHNTYGEAGYGEGGGGYTTNYGYRHHLVDDFICDLDASILVVANSHRHEYGRENHHGYEHKKEDYGEHAKHGYEAHHEGYEGKEEGQAYGNEEYGHHNHYENEYHHKAVAHRLRCSRIAIRNDSDCTTCCQLAARRDKSISKDSIFGFIIDYDQVNFNNHYRKKRNAGVAQPPGISPASVPNVEPTKQKETPFQPVNKQQQNEFKENPIPKFQGGIDEHKKHEEVDYGHKGYEGHEYGNNYRYKIHHPPIPYFPPYNPRCVCCAPKHHHGYHHHGYNHHGGDRYGSSHNYNNNENYGHNHHHHNHHGGYENHAYAGHHHHQNENYGGAGAGYGYQNEGYGQEYGGGHQHGYGNEAYATGGYGSGYGNSGYTNKQHYGGGGGAGAYDYGKR